MSTCESDIPVTRAARRQAWLDAEAETLPRAAWLSFPPLMLLVAVPLLLADKALYKQLFDHELGIVELMTPAVLVIGIAFGLATLTRIKRVAVPRARLWVLLVTLGCIYFAGEEVSWGQHFFGWETPEALGALNNQNETNLHNISTWLDQKPRMFLELWVVVGGLYMPWRLRRRPLAQHETLRDWFWPTYELLPTALLATLIRLPERVANAGGLRYSEFQEYYFGLFLSLYLVSVWRRVARLPDPDG